MDQPREIHAYEYRAAVVQRLLVAAARRLGGASETVAPVHVVLRAVDVWDEGR